MASKRKIEDVVAFIHSVSPQKASKSFNFQVQTEKSGNKTVKALCFDTKKRETLLNAQMTGEPVKFKKIIDQSADEIKKYYAHYIVGGDTSVEKLESATIPFERIEPEIVFHPLGEEHAVGSLVSVKAQIDLSRAIEKDVKVGVRNSKLLNQCFAFDDSGTQELAVWEEWIEFLQNSVHNGNQYFKLVNLLVREFNGTKYLSTCSDTEIKIIEDELPPAAQPLVEPTEDIIISRFEFVHKVEFGYTCKKCRKSIVLSNRPSELVKCPHCDVLSRSENLVQSYLAFVETPQLGDKVFKININEFEGQGDIQNINFDTDKSQLSEKLMNLRNIYVQVDRKLMELKVVGQ